MTYSLADFVRFASKLKTEAGRPLKLHKFQKDLLRSYFAGVRQTIIVLPTGNGKTTLMAALGLYHMLRVPNAQVLIVASAEEQAATLFKQMRTLISESDYADLLDVKGGQYRIYHKGDGPNRRPPGEIRVIASEVKRQEGAIPTLVLVDELHAHKDLQMYEMLRDKLWKRGSEPGCGRMVAISTAGFSFDSPLWVLKTKMEKLPTYHRHGFSNQASANGLEWLEYAMNPDQNRRDVGLVAKANPAPWITRRVLRERLLDVTLSPGEWARSACNVWTAGEDPLILPEEWDPLRVDIGGLAPGDEVWLAPSAAEASAAIGIASWRADDRVAVGAVVLEKREGRSLLVDVEQMMLDLDRRYEVQGFLDPGRAFLRSADILEEEGLPRIEAVWSPQRKMAATGTFLRMLRSGLLMHDGDPVLREHVLKVTLRASGGEEYMDVNPYDRAAVAVAMAVHHAVANAPQDLEFISATG